MTHTHRKLSLSLYIMLSIFLLLPKSLIYEHPISALADMKIHEISELTSFWKNQRSVIVQSGLLDGLHFAAIPKFQMVMIKIQNISLKVMDLKFCKCIECG